MGSVPSTSHPHPLTPPVPPLSLNPPPCLYRTALPLTLAHAKSSHVRPVTRTRETLTSLDNNFWSPPEFLTRVTLTVIWGPYQRLWLVWAVIYAVHSSDNLEIMGPACFWFGPERPTQEADVLMVEREREIERERERKFSPIRIPFFCFFVFTL